MNKFYKTKNYFLKPHYCVLLSSLIFTGCVTTGTLCKSPDEKIARIEVFKTAKEIIIYKDRFNLAGETIYSTTNFDVSDNKVSASVELKSRVFSWSGLVASSDVELDLNNKSIQIGQTTYACDEAFEIEVAKLK